MKTNIWFFRSVSGITSGPTGEFSALEEVQKEPQNTLGGGGLAPHLDQGGSGAPRRNHLGSFAADSDLAASWFDVFNLTVASS